MFRLLRVHCQIGQRWTTSRPFVKLQTDRVPAPRSVQSRATFSAEANCHPPALPFSQSESEAPRTESRTMATHRIGARELHPARLPILLPRTISAGSFEHLHQTLAQ